MTKGPEELSENRRRVRVSTAMILRQFGVRRKSRSERRLELERSSPTRQQPYFADRPSSRLRRQATRQRRVALVKRTERVNTFFI